MNLVVVTEDGIATLIVPKRELLLQLSKKPEHTDLLNMISLGVARANKFEHPESEVLTGNNPEADLRLVTDIMNHDPDPGPIAKIGPGGDYVREF